jgi:uncharacterized membrane protein HdeD (DUF308 family)
MELMKISYETGTATLIQFMVLGILNLVNGLNSIISSCHSGKDCATNAIVTPIYYILVTGWFASLWVLGYFAQERRSKWLARLLICAEGLVALVALFNAKHHNEFIGLFTSVVDLALAVWVAFVAFRLMLAGPARVVSHKRGAGHSRPRQRKRPT